MVTTRKKQPAKAPAKGTRKSPKASPPVNKSSKPKPTTSKKMNTKANTTPTVTTPKKTTKTKAKATPKVTKPAIQPERQVKVSSNDSVMPYKFQPYEPLKDEAYMSDKQLQHFRHILETWKKDLKKEVDNTITEMKDASVSVLADPNDRATEEEIFALKLRTRDRERKLIHKIEEALQLIDDKEYGYCESCGVEIGIRRLEARPTAFLCIDCKTLDEIRERNMQ